jgi:hypothetical protein
MRVLSSLQVLYPDTQELMFFALLIIFCTYKYMYYEGILEYVFVFWSPVLYD